jgi:hypothetical protein
MPIVHIITIHITYIFTENRVIKSTLNVQSKKKRYKHTQRQYDKTIIVVIYEHLTQQCYN